MKKYIQLTLVLLIISGLSGLVLGFTNEFTKGAIEEVQLNKINNNMHKWFPDVPLENKKENATPDDYELTEMVNNVYEAKNSSGDIVGYVIKVSAPDSFGGGMMLLVGINIKGEVVGFEYFAFNETGPGANVRNNDKFKNQFIGVSGSVYYNSTTDNNVDIVSGASYTSKATIKGINIALDYFNDHIKE